MLREFDALRAAIDRLATSEYTTAAAGSWSPAFTGFSANPASGVYQYYLVGKLCTLFVAMPSTGTSNATTFTLTAPFTAATIAGMVWYAPIRATDNSAFVTTPGMLMLSSNSATLNLYKDFNAAAWTATGGKSASFTFSYLIA